MKFRVPFPFLPWEFSLAGKDPHSLYNLGLRPLLVLHVHTYHHSHHRGNVTAPYGSPNLRSRLNFRHNQEGRPRSPYGHVVALEKKIHADRRPSGNNYLTLCSENNNNNIIIFSLIIFAFYVNVQFLNADFDILEIKHFSSSELPIPGKYHWQH
jgi:hypothetical protein